MNHEISSCRICKNNSLIDLIDLGNLELTGIFPDNINIDIPRSPLQLVKCDNTKKNSCGLVQLKHSYNFNKDYWQNYGYRSSLNNSMVSHLKTIAEKIINTVKITKNDLILDIGSNDGTLLNAYPKKICSLAGIDPGANAYKEQYPQHIDIIPDFFSLQAIKKHFSNKKIRVITSIAMFYDLEAPLKFMAEIYQIIDNDGIWLFEQSYMPSMIDKISYDTICHEHLAYYTLKQIKWMTDKVGFKIIDVDFNNINGGSVSITVAKQSSTKYKAYPSLDQLIKKEDRFDRLKPFRDFKHKILEHSHNLHQLLSQLKRDNKMVIGYGASTKGNIIINNCNITSDLMPFIAEINTDKFSHFCPGSKIKIIPETDLPKLKPDYLLVFPWHFKDMIIKKEEDFLQNGGHIIFPLPEITII